MGLPLPATVLAASRQRSTEFSEMYARVTEAVRPEPARAVVLRPSGFPVCSLTLLDAMLHPEEAEWAYSSDFFTSVGTTVHAVVERWASRTGCRLWGNWKCHNPRCSDHHGLQVREYDGAQHVHTVSREWYHTDVSACPTCGVEGSYEEITIEYLGVRGHIDCILITPLGIIVGDYKTTSRYGLDKPTFRDHNLAYTLQLFSYTYMLHRVWGEHFMRVYSLQIVGSSLLYINRDNPFRTREFHWAADVGLPQGRQVVDQARRAMRSARRSIAEGTLDSAVRHKNCKVPEQYDDEVSRYFCYEPCSLSGVCFNSHDLNAHFSDSLEGTRETHTQRTERVKPRGLDSSAHRPDIRGGKIPDSTR